MTDTTELHGWVLPVPDSVSQEDRDAWAVPQRDFWDNDLDKQVPLNGPVADRPTTGDFPGLIWIVTDSNPIEITYDNGTQWVVIGTTDVDTIDGLDSTQFLRSDQDDTTTGRLTSDVGLNTPELNGTITGNTALSDITGSNLSIDGSGVLNATDTNTDTRTDISDSGTQVLTDTTDINFDTNMSVADDGDGSVTVSASGGGGGSQTTLFMSNYASTGGVVDTEFDTAISDASPHDTIVFDHNSYELAAAHTIAKPLTIKGVDSTISCTNTANNNAAIQFQGGGLGSSTTTTEVANVGERSIAVNDSVPFSAGTRILIMNAAYGETVDAKIHFAEVESTASGSISLMDSLSVEFASGVNVYVVDLLDSPKMVDLNTDGGGTTHLQFRWCEDPEFRNCHISEYLEPSLYSLDCWKPRYHGVEATDPMGLASGEGEPIALYRCTDGYIESPRVYDCRRGIDFAWGAREMDVIDPVLRGVSLNGISVHQDQQSGHISIQGGEIITAEDGQSGNGISASSSADLRINGTRIAAGQNGILCQGPTMISDVTIEPLGVDTTPVAGIHIFSDDVFVKNTKINDPNGFFQSPVWIQPSGGVHIERIELDVKVFSVGPNHVQIDARDGQISDVEIHGMFDQLGASGTQQGILVRADGAHDITKVNFNSVNMEAFGDQAIRLLANDPQSLTAITFDDCSFNSGTAGIFTDGTGSFQDISVSNSWFNTGATSLSFNESGITKLIIVNNILNGSIDSSGSTNKTVTGNLGP